jgi:hypothetical protein
MNTYRVVFSYPDLPDHSVVIKTRNEHCAIQAAMESAMNDGKPESGRYTISRIA